MDSSNSDRLSELPDALILEILSLLPMNDVVATMLLSKRWLPLWTAVPCLDFQFKYKYEEFVSGALARWKGSKIRKISFGFDPNNTAMVNSWLLFAIHKQVEELDLSCDDDDDDDDDRMSDNDCCPLKPLYSCSSVTKMSLTFRNLTIIDEAVQWNRLKSLRIEVSLSEDAMNRILAGAPLLEELILVEFHSGENLNIRSTSLKILDLAICDYTLLAQVVRIWAPNLLDLKISGCFFGTFLLDVPSLINAEMCFREPHFAYEMFHQLFQSIRHVEKLTLSKINIKPLLRMKHIFEFPNVKSLSLYVARAEEMLGVLHMFPNLTTLWAGHDEEVFFSSEEELEEDDQVIDSHLYKADLPSLFLPFLKRVEITWYKRNVSIIPALEILLENANSLDKMVVTENWAY